MSEPSQEAQARRGTSSSIRPYIAVIDTLTESYQSGTKSKFEVVSAVTQISTKTPTSHLKREPSPSRFSWVRLKRQRLNDEGERRDETLSQGPLLEEINLHEHLLPMPRNQTTAGTLVMERFKQNLTQGMKDLKSAKSFNHQTCHGMGEGVSELAPSTPAVSSHQKSFDDSTKTSNLPNCLFDSPQMLQEGFPCLSGSIFSRERQLTLTGSCCYFTVLQLIQRERLALETQKSALAALKQNRRWRQALNGLLCGDPLCERLALSLSIENKNSMSMETILNGCSQPSECVHMPRLSCTTEELEMKSEGDSLSCSPTTNISPLCTQQHCKMMGLSTTREESQEEETDWRSQNLKSVEGLMAQQGVNSLIQDANTNTFASPVDSEDMGRRPVESERWEEKLGLKPKYLRHNLWSLEAESKMTAAEWTESAEPLPRPPPCEYENLPVCHSLRKRPDLF